jgi:hypothetical protein
MHLIFPRRPGALAAVFFKIRFSAFREVFFPGGFKIGPRLPERLCRAFGMPPMLGRRVKAALLAPLVNVNRNARPDRNRPDVHVAVTDLPAVRAIGISAAGEGWAWRHDCADWTGREAATVWGRRGASAHDQADRDARNHALQVAAS